MAGHETETISVFSLSLPATMELIAEFQGVFLTSLMGLDAAAHDAMALTLGMPGRYGRRHFALHLLGFDNVVPDVRGAVARYRQLKGKP